MANILNTKRPKLHEADLHRLVGERTVLRDVTATDLPALEAWDADPAISALMGRKYAETDADDWFRSLSKGRTCRAWAIETADGRLIGELELADLNRRTGSTELRICIGEQNCWGHGYGSDAIRTALHAAFDHLGLRLVYLRVFANNARAVHVYERIGFHKQAVLQPSARREDPSPVYLMNFPRERWYRRAPGCTKLSERAHATRSL